MTTPYQVLWSCTHERLVPSVLSDSLWTIAHQAPLSMGFSRQEYWSGLSFSSPGDLPDPGIEPSSTMSPALAGGFFTTSTTWQKYVNHELLDIQAGFRKGRGTRDQIANIRWIMEKAREFQKKSISALLTMPKPLTVWITINCGKF